jgi:15-cis-phytoene synthase
VTSLEDRDRAFALQHVPGPKRAAVSALWALDEQLGQIVATTTESMVGQMRLLWWREALESAVCGHPVLEAMASVEAAGVDRASLAALVDGWEVLLDPLPLDAELLRAYAEGRGTRLFALTSRILGTEALDNAGAGWALADFAFRCSDPVMSSRALEMAASALASARLRTLPRPLRILVRLARSDVAAGRKTPRSPWKLLRSVA